MRLLLWLAVAILVLAINVEADLLGLAGDTSSTTEAKPTPTSESPSPTAPSPTHAATTTEAQPPPPAHTSTTTHAPAPATSAPTSAAATSVVHTSSSLPVSSSLPFSSSITPLTSTALVSASLNATSASASATATSTAASSSDDSSSNSKPIIIGSICGFVAIIAAGFGYAFLSKTRRNNRKKRVFGADEDDGMDPSIPAPSPFQRHNETLAPAAATWETDQKRPLGPPSPYADYNYPSPALTQNGVRRSPPVAHTDAYYAQPPAASPYYDEHQQTYDHQTYYEQYPQQPMEMQHVTSPQMHQQYQYYGHNDPYNYRQ
ncbi:hypothetical protein INT43_008443 [Umbelopsis isabellina]|uniref:Mid2 domain-containing protein n=1 Tax=Mortierella isabellina TaxID=91625 RepID=A0A8H7UJ27_MORIS|nr:hypothetical protein INT43_008443 [Umbelopsis isabellina]